MSTVKTDYCYSRIPVVCQQDPRLVLALMGVLNSSTGRYQLFYSSICVEREDRLYYENRQQFRYVATLVDRAGHSVLKRLDTKGCPLLASEYFCAEFERFLLKRRDTIYTDVHGEV